MPHFFDRKETGRKETPRPALRLLINCNCSAPSGQTHFVQTMPALNSQNKTFIARFVKVGGANLSLAHSIFKWERVEFQNEFASFRNSGEGKGGGMRTVF